MTSPRHFRMLCIQVLEVGLKNIYIGDPRPCIPPHVMASAAIWLKLGGI